MEDKELQVEAANVLLRHPNAVDLYRQLMEVIALPSHLDVRLAGEAAVLNPLLKLSKNDPPRLQKIFELVELRREAIGVEPLAPQKVDKFDRNSYQRVLMAERRARGVKAADVENLRRPPSSQLIGHARLDFINRQNVKWTAQLKARLVSAFGTGPISKADRTRVSEAYYAEVDQALAESEAAVLRWIQSGRKGVAP